ncbi:hypothetical protein HMPREF0322_01243 [Desulfitobacterium hafniense DP7]|uniref:Uncharacterized protein n=1 Tax=Desulfitobacterium hafniense DP7 TaxID=537010 RepID=G9XJW2_DESHA|nr:hypothetical protein HMPREF0322_01243 [Desulfitobacterium hafniense DP7]
MDKKSQANSWGIDCFEPEVLDNTSTIQLLEPLAYFLHYKIHITSPSPLKR